METEIRAAFSRLSRSSGGGNRGSSGDTSSGRPSAVRLLPLMSALRPLVLRDGDTLVRAAANVLRRVDIPDVGAGGGANNQRNAMVTLIPPYGNSGPHQQQVRVFVFGGRLQLFCGVTRQ